jgi:cytochrome b6-f complex iron-sulfur subunit
VGDGVQTRRGFLDWLIRGGIVALLGSIFYPVIRYITPPPSAEASVSQVKLPDKVADLEAEPKKFKIFKFGQQLGIIVVAPDGSLKAFSAICTHLSCTVQYRPDESVLWCACHNGKFDLQGRNISGPPPKPLEVYAVHVNDTTGEIFVAKQSM